MANSLVVRRGTELAKRIKALRAAQYVRMSTDFQRYSIENQAAAIAAYAQQKRFTIVRTYVDEGRSGLRIKGRAGRSHRRTMRRCHRVSTDAADPDAPRRGAAFRATQRAVRERWKWRPTASHIWPCPALVMNSPENSASLRLGQKRALQVPRTELSRPPVRHPRTIYFYKYNDC